MLMRLTLLGLSLAMIFSVLGFIVSYYKSDTFEWYLLKQGYFPIDRLPDSASIGDIFLLGPDLEVSVEDPALVCGLSQEQVSQAGRGFVVTRPTIELSNGQRFIENVANYLNMPLKDVTAISGPLVRHSVLRVSEYVEYIFSVKPDCESELTSLADGRCALFFVSETAFAGRKVAFATSLFCQLFDYTELSSEDVDKLTERKYFGEYFGIDLVMAQRIALFMSGWFPLKT